MNSLKSKACIAGISIFFASLIFSPKAFPRELKIAVVDVEKIYNSYEKAKISDNEFQGERKQKQDELDKKTDELKKLVADYNKNKDSMKEQQRKDAQTKIIEKRNELADFKQKTDEQLLKKKQDVTQQRLKEISDVIQAYAKDNGLDLVIDKKALPFFSQGLDISGQVIDKLNNK